MLNFIEIFASLNLLKKDILQIISWLCSHFGNTPKTGVIH